MAAKGTRNDPAPEIGGPFTASMQRAMPQQIQRLADDRFAVLKNRQEAFTLNFCVVRIASSGGLAG